MLSRRSFFKSIAAAFAATSLRIGIGLSELAPPIEHVASKLRKFFRKETFIFYRYGERNEHVSRHERTFYLSGDMDGLCWDEVALNNHFIMSTEEEWNEDQKDAPNN